MTEVIQYIEGPWKNDSIIETKCIKCGIKVLSNGIKPTCMKCEDLENTE